MEYKQVEEDLQYLAKTDERYAELKAGVEHMKNMLKSVKGSFVTNSKESVSKATEAFYADKNYIDVRDVAGSYIPALSRKNDGSNFNKYYLWLLYGKSYGLLYNCKMGHGF